MPTVTASDISMQLLLSARDNFAAGNDQLVVTAIAGYRIRLCGWIAQSTTATIGSFALKTGSGGTKLMEALGVPSYTTGLDDKLLIVDSGYAETGTGVGLYVDVSTAAVGLTVFYKVYVP